MLPPRVAELLDAAGHDATTPTQLGAHNLPDDVLVQLAAADDRVIVTENASDFAATTACPVLLVRKAWWPAASLGLCGVRLRCRARPGALQGDLGGRGRQVAVERFCLRARHVEHRNPECADLARQVDAQPAREPPRQR
jgi:hypothetical protein